MKWQNVDSSVIKNVRFKTEGIMDVQFTSGQVYSYYEVPQSIYENLINAESVGMFFQNNVKGNFKYRKL